MLSGSWLGAALILNLIVAGVSRQSTRYQLGLVVWLRLVPRPRVPKLRERGRLLGMCQSSLWRLAPAGAGAGEAGPGQEGRQEAAVNKWIDVGEQLPEQGIWVLGLVKTPMVHDVPMVVFHMDTGWWNAHDPGGGNEMYPQAVTHWMPLPDWGPQ